MPETNKNSLLLVKPITNNSASKTSVKSTKSTSKDKSTSKSKPTRVRPNTSSTSEGDFGVLVSGNKNSTELEDYINNHLYGAYGDPNTKYSVPFLEDKLIKVAGNNISSNTLDSIAKYAGQAGIDIKDALGLYKHETVTGSVPIINTASALKINKNGRTMSKKEEKIRDRIILNSNYHRNYGTIPAQYLIRDFEYNTGGYNNNKPYDRDIPPLLHGFDYFARGLYNPGNKSHSKSVRNAGETMFNDPNVQEWWDKSGKKYYEQPVTETTKRQLMSLDEVYPIKRFKSKTNK